MFAFALAETSTNEWYALHTRLQSLARNRGAAEAEEARCLRLAERLRIWREVGEPSMFAYVERVLGYGPRCAYDRLRVARALGELPAMEQALARGDLFYSVVRELTRVAIGETEEDWLAAARDRTLREVEQMVSGRGPGDLPDAPSLPENVRHVLRHEVSAETFALMRQARNALQDEIGEALDDDAFLSLLAGRALESTGGKAPRHQIVVTTCDQCKRTWQDGAGAVVELDAPTLERIECDADRIDAEGRITRHIPEPTRRMVLRRDHHRCRVPGCRSSRNLDVHHVVEFAHGGNHEAPNLVTICSGHHRAIHEGRLTLAMENGAPTFERKAPMPAANDTHASVRETAERALMGLGFKKAEAQSYVESAIAHVGKTATIDVLVREALKSSPMPRTK